MSARRWLGNFLDFGGRISDVTEAICTLLVKVCSTPPPHALLCVLCVKGTD